MSALSGFDRWSGSQHQVTVGTDGPFVLITVEATSGSQVGEALITPAQADALVKALNGAASEAIKQSEMT